jgi:hypothetical protein
MNADLGSALYGLACALVGAALGGFLGLLAGQMVGSRDAANLARMDRAAEFARCTEGELPMLLMRDAARPERDLWMCTGGSLRRAGK